MCESDGYSHVKSVVIKWRIRQSKKRLESSMAVCDIIYDLCSVCL